MLHEFLTTNREELISRCRAKVAKRRAPQAAEAEMRHGVRQFLEQLTKTLVLEAHRALSKSGEISGPSESDKKHSSSEMGETAAKHGNELLRKGFTVEQVVHGYGDVVQTVLELAIDQELPITIDEFGTLNRCLDNAVADAVTEYGRQHDQFVSDEGTQAANERLGYLAHELRNLLNSAMFSLQVIKSGKVGMTGPTGAVLDRSLIGLRNLIDRSLAEVRLTAGPLAQRERISIAEFIEEVQVFAAMEAMAKGLELTVQPVEPGLVVNADRHMLSSAVTNLLQNAFKFTHGQGQVSLKAYATADRVLIEIEDECGGLPPGKAEELFRPFEQRGDNRTGLGLGLSISRRGVEASGGKLHVRDLPGIGCVFTIDLPRHHHHRRHEALARPAQRHAHDKTTTRAEQVKMGKGSRPKRLLGTRSDRRSRDLTPRGSSS